MRKIDKCIVRTILSQESQCSNELSIQLGEENGDDDMKKVKGEAAKLY